MFLVKRRRGFDVAFRRPLANPRYLSTKVDNSSRAQRIHGESVTNKLRRYPQPTNRTHRHVHMYQFLIPTDQLGIHGYIHNTTSISTD